MNNFLYFSYRNVKILLFASSQVHGFRNAMEKFLLEISSTTSGVLSLLKSTVCILPILKSAGAAPLRNR